MAPCVWQVVVSALIVASAGALCAVTSTLLRNARQNHLIRDARRLVIAAPPEVDPHAAGTFWTTLIGALTTSACRRLLYGAPHVDWEYSWSGRQLTISLWVPSTVPRGAVEAAVHAAWPGSIVRVEEPAAALPLAVTAAMGGALLPARATGLPLRTDHDSDPLRALLAAGASLTTGEQAIVQVLARPLSNRRAAAMRRSAGSSRRADPTTRVVTALAQAALEPIIWLVDAFLPGPRHPRRLADQRTESRRDPVADREQRAVVDKAVAAPKWEIAIRYGVAATSRNSEPSPADISRLKDRTRGVAHAVASAAAVYTGPNRLRRVRIRRPVEVLNGRRLRRGFPVTVDELAALAALPQDIAVPGLDRARAKPVPPHALVPFGGRNVKVLGNAMVGGHAVGLNVADARQHLHIVGKTGSGKSTLLLNMVLSDFRAGRGTVVIDPRGDLCLDILDRLPASAANRVVIIDPDQPNPACFNPLDDRDDPHLAVDNIVAVFSKIFGRHWGPRIDDTLRVACLTLMRHANPTLSLVPPLLNSPQFRSRFTHDLDDPEGLAGYWTWYDTMPANLRAQVIAPVLARLRAFLLRDFVRDVIGSSHSSFSMADVLNGGLLLCRLPKGQLGEDTVRILGSLIVARVWQAATARAAIPENTRRDCTLLVDECQNFLHLPGSLGDMLAEARGFRLSLVLAHQNLAQLPDEIAAAASANARNKIYFTVDPNDARDLAKHTKPEVDDYDLGHLDAYTATARLVVDGREMPAFSLRARPAPPVVGETTAIRQAVASRAAGRSRRERTALEDLARETMRR